MLVEDGFLLYIVLFSQITYKWQSNSNCHLSIFGSLPCCLPSMTSKPVHSEVDFRLTQMFSQLNSQMNDLIAEKNTSFGPSPGNYFFP
jgi:hypothetical protein